ncbi:MAG: hypothetical protein WAL34_03945 [Acidobacteriaceae bacterium]
MPDDHSGAINTAEPAKKRSVRPWWPVMVTKDGGYLIRAKAHEGQPPHRIIMPWVSQTDPRLLVKNGQRWPVHQLIVFEFDRFVPTPKLGHDEARYYEMGRADFDPTDCVQIKDFDLEEYASGLNPELRPIG